VSCSNDCAPIKSYRAISPPAPDLITDQMWPDWGRGVNSWGLYSAISYLVKIHNNKVVQLMYSNLTKAFLNGKTSNNTGTYVALQLCNSDFITDITFTKWLWLQYSMNWWHHHQQSAQNTQLSPVSSTCWNYLDRGQYSTITSKTFYIDANYLILIIAIPDNST